MEQTHTRMGQLQWINKFSKEETFFKKNKKKKKKSSSYETEISYTENGLILME